MVSCTEQAHQGSGELCIHSIQHDGVSCRAVPGLNPPAPLDNKPLSKAPAVPVKTETTHTTGRSSALTCSTGHSHAFPAPVLQWPRWPKPSVALLQATQSA